MRQYKEGQETREIVVLKACDFYTEKDGGLWDLSGMSIRVQCGPYNVVFLEKRNDMSGFWGYTSRRKSGGRLLDRIHIGREERLIIDRVVPKAKPRAPKREVDDLEELLSGGAR
jgi:hypothetical protein